jgi:hypothetical protein
MRIPGLSSCVANATYYLGPYDARSISTITGCFNVSTALEAARHETINNPHAEHHIRYLPRPHEAIKDPISDVQQVQ